MTTIQEIKDAHNAIGTKANVSREVLRAEIRVIRTKLEMVNTPNARALVGILNRRLADQKTVWELTGTLQFATSILMGDL